MSKKYINILCITSTQYYQCDNLQQDKNVQFNNKKSMNNLISTSGNFHQTMSSLQIAELTGKTHSNVMRDIQSILDQ